MARRVFFSFHFASDFSRTQLVRNMGALEGNRPAQPQAWEEVKGRGDSAIKAWIDENMNGKSAVIVLVGAETSKSKWVEYEIRRAWDLKKGLLGIRVHNLKNLNGDKSPKGQNPFDNLQLNDGRPLSSLVPCYDPNPNDAYRNIQDSIVKWIDEAVQCAELR